MGDAHPHLVPGCLPQVGGGGRGTILGPVPHRGLERAGHTGRHRSCAQVGGWGPAGRPVLCWQPERSCPGDACLSPSSSLPGCWGGVLDNWVCCPHQH